MRLLLIEDDVDLADAVVRGLRQEHFATDHAPTIGDSIDFFLTTRYDLALIDLGLPDGDGLELCRRLQNDDELLRPRRILILTARDAVTDRVAGLDAGADDYLTKPFSMAELTARARALNRRTDEIGGDVAVGDLVINAARHRASRNGADLALTGREFSVLRYLVSRRDEVVSAEDLLEHCWDAHADGFTSTQRAAVAKLRAKLGEPPMIETIRGVGYRLAAAE